jgi:hypothetical protein
MVLEDPDGRRGAVVQGVGSLLRDREKVFKSECVCVGWGGGEEWVIMVEGEGLWGG